MNYFLVFLLLSSQLIGQTTLKNKSSNRSFSAKVIRIMDGDTMEVLYKKTPTKIRLAHIDCPEKKGTQPFGNQAKIALSYLCYGKRVLIVPHKYDRYARLIAVIINHKGENVNKEMLRKGMAWHYKKYSKDLSYAVLEIEARKNRVGLWQDNKPIEPWLWREKKKK